MNRYLCLQASQAFSWNKSQGSSICAPTPSTSLIFENVWNHSCSFFCRHTGLLAVCPPTQALSYLRAFAGVWNALRLLPRYLNTWLIPSVPSYLLKGHLSLSLYSFPPAAQTLSLFFFFLKKNINFSIETNVYFYFNRISHLSSSKV